jgi:calcium-dependent protein kinase
MVTSKFFNFFFLEPEWDDVSEDAKDLVKRLLAYDPEKRITASDALQHKWIKTMATAEKIEKAVALKTLANLKSFRVLCSSNGLG